MKYMVIFLLSGLATAAAVPRAVQGEQTGQFVFTYSSNFQDS